MTVIDDFISKVFQENVSKESYQNFVKYYNNNFEILCFKNRLLVKDKRNIEKTIIYNNMKIAEAKLKDILKIKR